MHHATHLTVATEIDIRIPTTLLFNEIHYSQVHESRRPAVYRISGPVIQSALFSSPRRSVILVLSQLLAPAKMTSHFQCSCEIWNHNETTTKSQWIKRLHVCQNWIYNTKKLSPRIFAAQMYLHKAVVDLRTKTLEGIFMTQFTLLLCYLTSPFCEQSICCKYSETPCQWGALTLAFAYMYLEGFQFCEAWCQGFWVYYGEMVGAIHLRRKACDFYESCG